MNFLWVGVKLISPDIYACIFLPFHHLFTFKSRCLILVFITSRSFVISLACTKRVFNISTGNLIFRISSFDYKPTPECTNQSNFGRTFETRYFQIQLIRVFWLQLCTLSHFNKYLQSYLFIRIYIFSYENYIFVYKQTILNSIILHKYFKFYNLYTNKVYIRI